MTAPTWRWSRSDELVWGLIYSEIGHAIGEPWWAKQPGARKKTVLRVYGVVDLQYKKYVSKISQMEKFVEDVVESVCRNVLDIWEPRVWLTHLSWGEIHETPCR